MAASSAGGPARAHRRRGPRPRWQRWVRRPVGAVARALHLISPRDAPARRYEVLTEIVRTNKSRLIMEIGTRNGTGAMRMIREALRHHQASQVEYFGFDLWEMLDEAMLEKEFSKVALPMGEVNETLETTGATITLFKGFTSDTLPLVVPSLPKMDFIFIDGGHSIETIENDWRYAEQLMGDETVVVFDDYYTGAWGSRKDIGCQSLIDNGVDRSAFDVEVLPPQDRFRRQEGELRINFVRVQRRKR